LSCKMWQTTYVDKRKIQKLTTFENPYIKQCFIHSYPYFNAIFSVQDT